MSNKHLGPCGLRSIPTKYYDGGSKEAFAKQAVDAADALILELCKSQTEL